LDKTVVDRTRELGEVRGDSGEINRINEDYTDKNAKLKKDLLYCQ
jgi:hypothetical protein